MTVATLMLTALLKVVSVLVFEIAVAIMVFVVSFTHLDKEVLFVGNNKEKGIRFTALAL